MNEHINDKTPFCNDTMNHTIDTTNDILINIKGHSLLDPSVDSDDNTVELCRSPLDVEATCKVESTTATATATTRYSFLAQIERQNNLLEKDLNTMCIEQYGYDPTIHSIIINDLPLPSTLIDNDKQQVYKQLQQTDKEFWQALIQDPIHLTKKTPHLLSVKLRSGTPSHVRGLIWQAVSQSSSLHLETVYGKLCKDRSPHESIILRDLARTYPTIDMFKEENGPGQLALCRILVAYSLYDPHVGYCQGLAFLVGPLLMTMPEPQAFCVFVRMMEAYEMRSMFTLEMEGLQLRLYQFSCLLQEHLPNLASHLDKHAIHAAMYASQWFLTLFAYAYPMELVTRIYDILFIEGATETMMRVAISLLQRSEQVILMEDEFEDLLYCVCSKKLCDSYANDWSRMIDDAMTLSNKITRQKLDQLEKEYAHVQQETMKSDQVLENRPEKFWWRKSPKQRKVLERSISSINLAGGGFTGSKRYVENNHITTARNRIQSADGTYGSAVVMPSPAFRMELASHAAYEHDRESTPAQLRRALDQLRKDHYRVIDELFETRMDKKDVETERDALKMTIMELERRNQTLPAFGYATAPDSIDSAGSTDHQQLYLFGNGNPLENHGTSLSSLASCSDMTLINTTGRRNTSSSVSSSSDLAFFNFTPPTTTPSSLKNVSFSGSNSSEVTEALDLSWKSTTDDSEGDALRTELVRIKVDHFETQQQCERLAQEVEDYQSRLDMVNEGQIALVNKLVTMTSERDELLQTKEQYDEKWLDLMQENSRLTVQLQEYNNLKQQTPFKDNLMDRIYELETSLAAAKVRLAEFELSTDDQQDNSSIQHTRDELEPIITNTSTIYKDDVYNGAVHDRALEIKAADDSRLAKSTSLYGRVWHAISPRSQRIGPC